MALNQCEMHLVVVNQCEIHLVALNQCEMHLVALNQCEIHLVALNQQQFWSSTRAKKNLKSVRYHYMKFHCKKFHPSMKLGIYMWYCYLSTRYMYISHPVLEEVGIKILVESLGEGDTSLPPGHLRRGERKIHCTSIYFCKA